MPKRTAFLFPGQGSQTVGMGKEWAEVFPLARELFDTADEIMGRSLSEVCFEGPEEVLKLTENAQPGLYLCGIAGAALLAVAGVQNIEAAVGHSLGEYAALAAAGVYEWEEGLRLVRARGEAMNRAAEENPGTMAAILGLDDEAVAAACEQVADAGLVKPANFNGPGQVVVSGEVDAVEAAVEACKAAGAKRAIPLPVHGAFHSPLMEPAVGPMREALEKAEFVDPKITFIANVTGERMSNCESIREGLALQITSCVRWTETMRQLLDDGIELFVEIGPGKALSGMLKRMDRSVKCLNCSAPEDIDKVLEAYQS